MTCIVGIKTEDGIWMGADSLGSTSSFKVNREDTKLFTNGYYTIGYTSSFRMGQLLQYHLSVGEPTPGVSNHEHMVTKFVPAVRALFKEHGYGSGSDDEGGTFIVAYNGDLFEIECDFQVGVHRTGIYAVGSGSEVAYGALYASRFLGLGEESSCKLALEAAEHYVPSVQGPFTVEKIE